LVRLKEVIIMLKYIGNLDGDKRYVPGPGAYTATV
jgi:hypothetical protein